MQTRVFCIISVAFLPVFACSSGSNLGTPPQDLGDDSVGPPSDGGSADGTTGSRDGGLGAKDGGVSGGQPLTPGTTTSTIDGHAVIVHVPSSVTGHPLPLVLALHGNGDTNTNFVAAFGLSGLADTDGFVLAAPQGTERMVTFMTQTIGPVPWDAYNAPGANDDITLLDDITASLVASGSIDTKRIFVYGYSQGGYMSFRYGMADSATLSCAAIIAGGDPFGGSIPSVVTGAARKIPVAMQVGDADNTGAQTSAQTADQELMANGNPVQYNVINGGQHSPPPGDITVPLDYCRGKSLP